MESWVIATIVTAIVAFSGWIKLLHDLLTSAPKIKGQIFNVIIGDMPHPDGLGGTLTTFLVYLYLTNERKNSVHILDYELEIDSGNGFERVDRVYGVQNVQNWGFLSQTHSIEIADFNEKLIYKNNKPVEYGTPTHGFVLFASRKPRSHFFEHGDQIKYKVTCIDAFQKRHEIICSPDQFPSLYLLQDLAGIKLIPLKK